MDFSMGQVLSLWFVEWALHLDTGRLLTRIIWDIAPFVYSVSPRLQVVLLGV